MQTFSDMRRSRFDYQPLVLLLLFLFALIYESIGTIYPYLTPLLGVGFYYYSEHYTQRRHYFKLFLFFLYTLFFELDREMILFSFVTLVMIYHVSLQKFVEDSLNCQVCKVIMKIAYAYLGYYVLNIFLAFVLNMPYPQFDISYLIYIISDLFLVVVFL